MWCRLTSRISDEHIDALLGRAAALVCSSDGNESVRWRGKEFFADKLREPSNFDLLKLFHGEIWPEISNNVPLDVPVIDHASLLIKGTGAAGTAMHQDRPYWVGREASPSIFSVWIALEDMSEEKGGLMVSLDNEVGVDQMSSLNNGSILEHVEDTELDGGFPISIPARTASRMAASMGFVELAKGQAIAFDSFEPHMSGPNTTSTPRLAMKIAYAEGKGKTRYLTRLDTLEGSSKVR